MSGRDEILGILGEDKIDKGWVDGIRKGLKQVLQKAKVYPGRLSSASSMDPKIMADQYEAAQKALGGVKGYIASLREDLLMNKGLWTLPSKAGKSEDSLLSKYGTKVVEELDAADEAVLDGLSHMRWSFEGMDPVDRFGRPGMYHQEAYGSQKGFDFFLNAFGVRVDEAVEKVEDALSGRLLRHLTSMITKYKSPIDLPEIEPRVVHIGKATVIFNDISDTDEILSPSKIGTQTTTGDELKTVTDLSVRTKSRGGYVDPRKRRSFISGLNDARAALRSKGLEHLFAGEFSIEPEGRGGINPYGAELGVAGRYRRSGDSISFYGEWDANSVAVIAAHEIGHRYYFKFMTDSQRREFDKFFLSVPAVSSYGGKSTVEDFAEVFMWYVLGRKLTKDQRDRFEQFMTRGTRRFEDRDMEMSSGFVQENTPEMTSLARKKANAYVDSLDGSAFNFARSYLDYLKTPVKFRGDPRGAQKVSVDDRPRNMSAEKANKILSDLDSIVEGVFERPFLSSWKPIPGKQGEFSAKTTVGDVVIAKRGKGGFVLLVGGREIELPKKASFRHAERVVQQFVRERIESMERLDEKRIGDLGKRGSWVKLKPVDISDSELSKELFDLVQTAYKGIGGHLKIKSPADISREMSFVYAIDTDDDPDMDAAVLGKSKAGLAKLSAVGHDGSPVAKNSAIEWSVNLVKSGKMFAGVSGAMAHIYLNKFGLKTLGQKDVERLLGKDIEWVGPRPDGKYPDHENWFYLSIGGERILKTMVGNVGIRESRRETMNSIAEEIRGIVKGAIAEDDQHIVEAQIDPNSDAVQFIRRVKDAAKPDVGDMLLRGNVSSLGPTASVFLNYANIPDSEGMGGVNFLNAKVQLRLVVHGFAADGSIATTLPGGLAGREEPPPGKLKVDALTRPYGVKFRAKTGDPAAVEKYIIAAMKAAGAVGQAGQVEESAPTGKAQIGLMDLAKSAGGEWVELTSIPYRQLPVKFSQLMTAANALKRKGMIEFDGKRFRVPSDIEEGMSPEDWARGVLAIDMLGSGSKATSTPMLSAKNRKLAQKILAKDEPKPIAKKKEASDYIKKIKNEDKRKYAEEYEKWIRGGRKGDDPSRGKLSYMGAQSVRMVLDEIYPDPNDVSEGVGGALSVKAWHDEIEIDEKIINALMAQSKVFGAWLEKVSGVGNWDMEVDQEGDSVMWKAPGGKLSVEVYWLPILSDPPTADITVEVKNGSEKKEKTFAKNRLRKETLSPDVILKWSEKMFSKSESVEEDWSPNQNPKPFDILDGKGSSVSGASKIPAGMVLKVSGTDASVKKTGDDEWEGSNGKKYKDNDVQRWLNSKLSIAFLRHESTPASEIRSIIG